MKKKLNLLVAGIVAVLMISTKVNAQSTPNYFVGKWDVLVKGTPQGDFHLMCTIADSAGTLKGTYLDPETKKDVPLTKIEQGDNKAKIYFTIQTYDVFLDMAKKDDDHITGKLMDMFDATGDRVK